MKKFLIIFLLYQLNVNYSHSEEKKVYKGWDIDYWGITVGFTSTTQDVSQVNKSLAEFEYPEISNKIPLMSFGINYGKLIPYIDPSENMTFWESINNWINKNTFFQANIQFSPTSIFPGLWEANLTQLNFNTKLNFEIPIANFLRFRAIFPSLSYNYNKLTTTRRDAFNYITKWDVLTSNNLSYGIGAGLDLMLVDKYYNAQKEIYRKLVIGIDFEYYFGGGFNSGWYDKGNYYVLSGLINPKGLKINFNVSVEIQKTIPFDFIKETMVNP